MDYDNLSQNIQDNNPFIELYGITYQNFKNQGISDEYSRLLTKSFMSVVVGLSADVMRSRDI